MHVAMQSRSRDIAKVLLVNGADKTRRTEVSKLFANVLRIVNPTHIIVIARNIGVRCVAQLGKGW